MQIIIFFFLNHHFHILLCWHSWAHILRILNQDMATYPYSRRHAFCMYFILPGLNVYPIMSQIYRTSWIINCHDKTVNSDTQVVNICFGELPVDKKKKLSTYYKHYSWLNPPPKWIRESHLEVLCMELEIAFGSVSEFKMKKHLTSLMKFYVVASSI